MVVPCSVRKDKADNVAIMDRPCPGMIADVCADRRILVASDIIVKAADPEA